jgi:hypothetical protein
MEHLMDPASLWQVQPVSNLPHSLLNPERPKKLEGKLVVLAVSDGPLNVRLQAKEYLITNRETAFCVILISLCLHLLLHTQKMLLN